LKALPFMLEDSIASDVTLEHLAVGADNAQAETLIAITRKQQLRDLLQAFSAAGITPSLLLPDYAMLRDSGDAWRILVSGDRAMARCPDGTGFSTPVSRLAMLLDTMQAPESGGLVKSIQLIRPADTSAPELPAGWQVTEQVVAGPLQHLAAEAHEASLNLLQGEFRVVEQSNWNWRPWAAAAVLAFVAIFISLLETGLETARLNRQSDQLQASIFELARDALPDAKQIRDPQAQLFIAWRELGNAGAGGAEFLPLLDRVAATVSQQPVTVREIHFKDGTLTLALQGESLQQLDNLREQIEQQGLSASLLNAGTDADSAHSNLVIKTTSPQATGSTG
jgi:general secretion pathway protein L